ncbi:NAD(+) synthetase [Candidatus Woesearchaeota archaeon]|jgi:NAD+ synthetase|nr:NAD(+) synthetase [Candidatus Woesearchaeota archaeon]|tara:strand:+ start:3762 stop:4574 length:813 start_codon:yes stop_codon:yes gene_type:complete
MKEIYNALILGIKDYFEKNEISKAVIGLSGGLDSSVVAYLAVKAIGKENLIGILMPDSVTSKESIKDAKKVAKGLGIKHDIIPIEGFMEVFDKINTNVELNDLSAIANVKARTRMIILYYLAQINNAFVLGTSDKSEIALGYTTKYGDNASDLLVIGDLWKTEVFKLGKFLGIPSSILKKKPSAELILGQTAEKELGASYHVLDRILKLYIENDFSSKEIKDNGFKKELVLNVVKRIKSNEHKRRAPVIIRLSERSFHNKDWRMPITNRF